MNCSIDDTLLDMSAIEDIRALDPDGSAGIVAQVIKMFIKGTEDFLEKSLSTDELNDLDSVRRAAHSLKSSAGTLGAKKLSALFMILETALRKGEDVDVQRSMAEIRSVYLRTRESMEMLLARSAS